MGSFGLWKIPTHGGLEDLVWIFSIQSLQAEFQLSFGHHQNIGKSIVQIVKMEDMCYLYELMAQDMVWNEKKKQLDKPIPKIKGKIIRIYKSPYELLNKDIIKMTLVKFIP